MHPPNLALAMRLYIFSINRCPGLTTTETWLRWPTSDSAGIDFLPATKSSSEQSQSSLPCGRLSSIESVKSPAISAVLKGPHSYVLPLEPQVGCMLPAWCPGCVSIPLLLEVLLWWSHLNNVIKNTSFSFSTYSKVLASASKILGAGDGQRVGLCPQIFGHPTSCPGTIAPGGELRQSCMPPECQFWPAGYPFLFFKDIVFNFIHLGVCQWTESRINSWYFINTLACHVVIKVQGSTSFFLSVKGNCHFNKLFAIWVSDEWTYAWTVNSVNSQNTLQQSHLHPNFIICITSN